MTTPVPNIGTIHRRIKTRLPTRSSLLGSELTSSEIQTILNSASSSATTTTTPHEYKGGTPSEDLLEWSNIDEINFSGNSRRRRASTTTSEEYMNTQAKPTLSERLKQKFFGTTVTLERSHLFVKYRKILNKALTRSKQKIDKMEKSRRSVERKSNKRLRNLYQLGITGPLLTPFKEASCLEVASVDVRIQRECRLCGLIVDQIALCDATTHDSFTVPEVKGGDDKKQQACEVKIASTAATEVQDTFFRLPLRLLADDDVGTQLIQKTLDLEQELTNLRAQCSALTNDYVVDRSMVQRGQQLLSVLAIHYDDNHKSMAITSEVEEWQQAVFESVTVDQRTREGRLLHNFFTQHLAQKMKQYQIFGDDCLPPPTTLLAFCTYLHQIVSASYATVLQDGIDAKDAEKVQHRLKRLITRIVFRKAKPLCDKYYTENVEKRAKEWECVVQNTQTLVLSELGAKEKFIPAQMQEKTKESRRRRRRRRSNMIPSTEEEQRLRSLELSSKKQAERVQALAVLMGSSSRQDGNGTNDNGTNDNSSNGGKDHNKNDDDNNDDDMTSSFENPYYRATRAFHSIFVPWRDSPMDAMDAMLQYIRVVHECAAEVSGGEEPGGLDDLFPLIVWTVSRATSAEVALEVHRGMTCLELFVEDVSGESAFYLCAIMSAVEYLVRNFGSKEEAADAEAEAELKQRGGRRKSMVPVQMSLKFDSKSNQKAISDLRSFLTHVDMEEDLVDSFL